MEPVLISKFDDIEPKFSAPWYLSHRVDLHNELRLLATRDEGPGEPAKIHLSTEVTGIVCITNDFMVYICVHNN